MKVIKLLAVAMLIPAGFATAQSGDMKGMDMSKRKDMKGMDMFRRRDYL